MARRRGEEEEEEEEEEEKEAFAATVSVSTAELGGAPLRRRVLEVRILPFLSEEEEEEGSRAPGPHMVDLGFQFIPVTHDDALIGNTKRKTRSERARDGACCRRVLSLLFLWSEGACRLIPPEEIILLFSDPIRRSE